MGTARSSSAKTACGAKATAIAASTSTPCTEFRSSLMMFSLYDALERVACMEIARAASITGQLEQKPVVQASGCYAGPSDELVEETQWSRLATSRRCSRIGVGATGLRSTSC